MSYESSEAHRDAIAFAHVEHLCRKYDAGQAEHGGRLWRKGQLLEQALEENIDQAIYLRTLAGRQRRVIELLAEGMAKDDWTLVSQALNLLTVGNEEGIPEVDR